jgi:kynureninase
LNLQKLDSQDPLQNISKISFPEVNEKKLIYLQEILWVCNQKNKSYVDEVMNDWANLAVEGHFTVKTMVGLSRTFCQTTE